MNFDIWHSTRLGWLLLFVLFLVFLLRLYQAQSSLTGTAWSQIYGQKGVWIGKVVEPPQITGSRQKIVLGDLAPGSGTASGEPEPGSSRSGATWLLSAWPPGPTLTLGVESSTLEGKLLVTTRLYPTYSFGDLVRIRGKILEPPVYESFDYKRYLALDGIYGVLSYPEVEKLEAGSWELAENRLERGVTWGLGLIYRFREQVQARIAKLLPEPHATLLGGVVFGIRGSYSSRTYQSLQRAGVLHVVVASGYNIIIVTGFLMAVASYWGRYQAVAVTAVGLLCYAVLAGLAPPILRAVIMGGGSLLAMLLGRQKNALFWLSFSALVLLSIKPLWLFSLSFQLSFLASLALIVLHPWVDRKLRFLPDLLHESFATTLSVQILTLPLVWWNFRQFYPLSVVVNTLALPVIDMIMPLGAMVVGLSFASEHLAQLAAWPLWLILEYFMGVVRLFA